MRRTPPQLPVVEVKKPGRPSLAALSKSLQQGSEKPKMEKPAKPAPSPKAKPPVPQKVAPMPAGKPPEVSRPAEGPEEKPAVKQPEVPFVPTDFIYQAVGMLHAPVFCEEAQPRDQYFTLLDGKRYNLVAGKMVRRSIKKAQAAAPERPLWFQVYPRLFSQPKGGVKELRFQVVRVVEDPASWVIREHGVFHIRGIWQLSLRKHRPAIAVFRNRDPRDPDRKYSFLNVPIKMERSDCQPYIFQPGRPYTEQMPRWFIQARFLFLPHEGVFQWVEDIKEPTRDLPPHVERKLPPRKNFTPPASPFNGPLL